MSEAAGVQQPGSDWERTARQIADCIAARPAEYPTAVVAAMADLVILLQTTGRPSPIVGPGYWPTFQVWWESAGVDDLWLEVFSDLIEVYQRTELLFAVWDEPHSPGQPFSDEFVAAMPLPLQAGPEA